MLFPYLRADGFPLTKLQRRVTPPQPGILLSQEHVSHPVPLALPPRMPQWGPWMAFTLNYLTLPSSSILFFHFYAFNLLAHPMFYFQYSSSLDFIAVFLRTPFPINSAGNFSVFWSVSVSARAVHACEHNFVSNTVWVANCLNRFICPFSFPTAS